MIRTSGFVIGISLGCLCMTTIVTMAEGQSDASLERQTGRFALVERPDGAIRLDTRTGEMSFCQTSGDGTWQCEVMLDDRPRLDDQDSLLDARLTELEDRLAALEATPKNLLGTPKPRAELQSETEKQSEEPSVGSRLAAEADRAFDFAEQFFWRFFKMIEDFKKGQDREEI